MSAPTMTKTTECPAWCGWAGHDHPWLIHRGEGYRFHRHETGRILNKELAAEPPLIVAVEVYETSEDGQAPAMVEVTAEDRIPHTGLIMTTAEQVREFVAAVIQAASIAFPDGADSVMAYRSPRPGGVEGG